MKLRTLLLANLLCFSFLVSKVLAQSETEQMPDTVHVFRLGEVIITDDREKTVSPVTLQRLTPSAMERTDATTVGGLAYKIPAARLQTNSRGESLLYMRNAGERQIALFFDGALLNVPWDNRVDLSLIPLNAVGGITISKGVPSVLYGANVVGGAVNIATQELRQPGTLTEVVAQFGPNAYGNGWLTHIGRTASLSYVASVGYRSSDGIPLPADATLPFSQSDPDLRTNTDSRSLSLFGQGEYHVSQNASVALSVNYIDAEKGVAPESHLESGARFWRYSDWRNLTVIANGRVFFGDEKEWALRGAFWGTKFRQVIDQYGNDSYKIRTATEEDDDFTLGGRVVLRRDIGSGNISLALNALQSTHDQVDPRYDSTGALKPFNPDTSSVPYPTATYRQQTFSAGLEFENKFTDHLTLTAGGSIDGMATPLTGDKPSQETFMDYSLMSGAVYTLTDELATRLSLGRKTRFPTMRELYGEALNRFLVNPDLKPEDATLIEVGIEGDYTDGTFAVIGFANSTTNTIDQRNVDTLGARRRQRINLEGSSVMGAEVSGNLKLFAPFNLEGHFTYAHARGRATAADGSDSTFLLSEKPEILTTITAGYEFSFGLGASVDMIHTGLAYSLNTDNKFASLEPSTTFNARLNYRLFLPLAGQSGTLIQIFVRANNLADAVTMPQLGLPGAGREIQGGVKATF